MAKAKKNRNAARKPEPNKEGKDLEKMTAQSLSPELKRFKVKLPIRIAVIILSVLALSWFFEGWREINKSITLVHVAVFVSGTVVTAALLYLQGFWIYLEEKYKGTLRRQIEHFEKLEQRWLKKGN